MKEKKPIYKRWWFILLVAFFIIGSLGNMGGNEDDKKEKNTPPVVETPNDPKVEYRTFSQTQIALLEKEYKDFDANETSTFENMMRDWDYLSEADKTTYQGNYNRLVAEKKAIEAELARIAEEERIKAEAEAKAKAEAEAKAKWEAFVAENSKTLGAGVYDAPEHIAVGVYDISFIGSGNFFVHGNDGLTYNEIGGSSYGVSKVRVYITENAEIEISGMKVKFVPIQRVLLPAEGFTLFPGYWLGGEEIPVGRYEVKPGRGQSGNFFVSGKSSINEILGGTYGVESVTVNIAEGDVVSIMSLNDVIFTPVK